MAVVLATRQSDPAGVPDLFRPSERGSQVELSLGSYSWGRRTGSGRCRSSSGRRWPVLLPQRRSRERQQRW